MLPVNVASCGFPPRNVPWHFHDPENEKGAGGSALAGYACANAYGQQTASKPVIKTVCVSHIGAPGLELKPCLDSKVRPVTHNALLGSCLRTSVTHGHL